MCRRPGGLAQENVTFSELAFKWLVWWCTIKSRGGRGGGGGGGEGDIPLLNDTCTLPYDTCRHLTTDIVGVWLNYIKNHKNNSVSYVHVTVYDNYLTYCSGLNGYFRLIDNGLNIFAHDSDFRSIWT